MEFINAILVGQQYQSVGKTKMARWRHIDLLLLLALVIILIFFNIFVNTNLKQQMIKRTNLDNIEDIVAEYSQKVQKNIFLLQQSFTNEVARLKQNQNELKKIIKIMSKQLGLPVQAEHQTIKLMRIYEELTEVTTDKNTYELSQIYQEIKQQQYIVQLPLNQQSKLPYDQLFCQPQTQNQLKQIIHNDAQSFPEKVGSAVNRQNVRSKSKARESNKSKETFVITTKESQKLNFNQILTGDPAHCFQQIMDLFLSFIYSSVRSFLILLCGILVCLLVSFVVCRKVKTRLTNSKNSQKRDYFAKRRYSKHEKIC